jgi:predicted nucleic-acid-binding protein
LIGLDTNLLVRLVVRDDLKQLELVERLIQGTSERGEDCFIADPVLCEIEWVLRSTYGAARQDVLAVMQELLAQDIFAFEDRDAIRKAIDRYQSSKAEFSDLLIGAKGKARGVRTTYTFDRGLAHQEDFSLLR